MFKPIKPTPPDRAIIHTFDGEMTVDQILGVIDEAVNSGVITSDSGVVATISGREGRYGDDFSVVIRAVTVAHEKQYEKDMTKYLVKKSTYDAWWAEKGPSITAKRNEREQNEKECRIKRLEKELERLRNG